METPDIVRWYVVHTKPKQEDRADLNLRAWGVQTFVPRIRVPRVGRDSAGVAYQVSPLFPRYLFARFDALSLSAKVRLTRGVHSIVGFGEVATPVDDSIVSALESRLRDDGCVHPLDPEPGDLVEIIDGPLRSLVGLFDRRLSGHDRVLILLSRIAYPTNIQISRASIRRVEIGTRV